MSLISNLYNLKNEPSSHRQSNLSVNINLTPENSEDEKHNLNNNALN